MTGQEGHQVLITCSSWVSSGAHERPGIGGGAVAEGVEGLRNRSLG